jgi:hypothetical protein
MSVTERITSYLSNGGLWNPELMEHEKVRELLIDARAEIERLQWYRQRWEKDHPPGGGKVMSGTLCYWCQVHNREADVWDEVSGPYCSGKEPGCKISIRERPVWEPYWGAKKQ